MTTAFSWFVRGKFDRSWHANPAGCVFALLTIPLVAWLTGSAVANRPAGVSSLARAGLAVLLAATAFCLASWLVRLIVSPTELTVAAPYNPAVDRSIGR
jgi:hypothetical protein